MLFKNEFSRWKYKHGTTTLENGLIVSCTVKRASTIQHDNSTSRYLPERNESICPDTAYTRMFKAAMLIIAPHWKLPRSPSAGRGTDCGISIHHHNDKKAQIITQLHDGPQNRALREEARAGGHTAQFWLCRSLERTKSAIVPESPTVVAWGWDGRSVTGRSRREHSGVMGMLSVVIVVVVTWIERL